MPIPLPKKYERQKAYIQRIIKYLARKYPKRYTPKQRVAIAFNNWRKNKRR